MTPEPHPGRLSDGQSSDSDPLDGPAEEFLARLRRGERPALTEYEQRYPALAGRIRALFPALVEMEQAGSLPGEGPLAVAPAGAVPARVGEFRILRKVGEGGMGVVYEAVQESLGRHVALKVLPPNRRGNYLDRFRREARAAAKLHHTNIVPVFGVGEADGLHFYAMQFIPGQGLDSVLEEVRRLRAARSSGAAQPVTPTQSAIARSVAESLVTGSFPRPAPPADGPPPSAPSSHGSRAELASQPEARYYKEVARIGVQVAEALAYAHGQGVLHRDVKPSNLLLDLHGTAWVTDFGLAKAADEEDLTQPGDVLGTLRYMAPERFRGHADARTEVYALGATLYELLTLRPAFEGTDRVALVEQVCHSVPPRPRKVDPQIPRDLETIVRKAMAREPADRYPTAAELAEDLRRFLSDRTITARRASVAEQLRRWAKRNKVVTVLATALVVLFVASTVAFTVGAARFGDKIREAETARSDAVNAARAAAAAEQRARLREAEALVEKAAGIRRSRRPGQRFEALAAIKLAAEIGRELGQPPAWFDRLRNEAASALALPDIHLTQGDWEAASEGADHRTASTDFVRYARSDPDGTVSVRRIADHAEVVRVPGFGEPAHLQLAPGGILVRVGARTGRFQVWDVRGPGPVLRVDDAGCADWHLRADRKRVAVLHHDWSVSLYDTATGDRTHHMPSAPPNGVDTPHVTLHPSAPVVVVSFYRSLGLEVRDLSARRSVTVPLPWGEGTGTPDWSPDGRTLAVPAPDSGQILLYHCGEDPTAGLRPGKTIHTGDGGPAVAFNPSGDRLAIQGWSSKLQLADVTTGRVLFSMPPVSRWGVRGVQFDDTGTRLGIARTGSRAERMGQWSVADGREYRILVPDQPADGYLWHALAVHPAGRLVAKTYRDRIAFFDLETGADLGFLPVRTDVNIQGSAIAFDGTGALLENNHFGFFRRVVRPDPPRAGRWVVGLPERLPFHPGHGGPAASRNGRVVAQPMHTGYGMGPYAGAWIWHAGEPGLLQVNRGLASQTMPVDPEGRWVAVNEKVFDAKTGEVVWQGSGLGYCNLFSPDGRWLATTFDGGRVYKTGTWEPAARLGPGGPTCISSDSRLVVMVADGTYRLVELATGRELVRLEDPELTTGHAAFSADGTKLLVSDTVGIRVWDLRLIRERLSEMELDWAAPAFPLAPPPPAPASLQWLTEESLAPVAGDDLRAGRWDAAAAALAVLPDDPAVRPTVLLYRSVAYDRLGRHEAADADRKLLGEFYLDIAGAYNRYAARHATRGERVLATALRESAARLRPDDPFTANHLARALVSAPARRQDPQRALALAERAVAAEPNRAEFHNTLGRVYYRLGRYPEAAAALERSLRLGGGRNEAASRYPLALCHHQQGNTFWAWVEFARAADWHWRSRLVLDPVTSADLADLAEEAVLTLLAPPRNP